MENIKIKNQIESELRKQKYSTKDYDLPEYPEKIEKQSEEKDDLFISQIEDYINGKRKTKSNPKPDQSFIPLNENIYDKIKLEKRFNKVLISSKIPLIHLLQFTSHKELVVENVEDNFERELEFMNQSDESCGVAFKELANYEIPSYRPEDYFAEMVKSDQHMFKIKKKLLYNKKVLEDREKKRINKDYQKLAKSIQDRKIREKVQRKKALISSMKTLKKITKKHGDDVINFQKQFDKRNKEIYKQDDIIRKARDEIILPESEFKPGRIKKKTKMKKKLKRHSKRRKKRKR